MLNYKWRFTERKTSVDKQKRKVTMKPTKPRSPTSKKSPSISPSHSVKSSPKKRNTRRKSSGSSQSSQKSRSPSASRKSSSSNKSDVTTIEHLNSLQIFEDSKTLTVDDVEVDAADIKADEELDAKNMVVSEEPQDVQHNNECIAQNKQPAPPLVVVKDYDCLDVFSGSPDESNFYHKKTFSTGSLSPLTSPINICRAFSFPLTPSGKLQKAARKAARGETDVCDAFDAMMRSSETVAAMGRRIYEMSEIYTEIDLKYDVCDKRAKKDQKSRLMMEQTKYKTMNKYKSVRANPLNYGLWDTIFNPDALIKLPNLKRNSPNTTNNGDSDVRNKKQIKEISSAEMQWCQKHTKLTEANIHKWFKVFNVECPQGILKKGKLGNLFKKAFPNGNGYVFADHLFRIFDKDNAGGIEFKAFMMAMDVTNCTTNEERIKWSFRVKDLDPNGVMSVTELSSIIEILDELNGCVEALLTTEIPSKKIGDIPTALERAEEVFRILDQDKSETISLEVFHNNAHLMFEE